MVCNTNDDLVILMHFRVEVLVLALYGTLVAFMTSIFAVISHVSLCATILICVICSLVGYSANNRLMFELVKRLYADRQGKVIQFGCLNRYVRLALKAKLCLLCFYIFILLLHNFYFSKVMK